MKEVPSFSSLKIQQLDLSLNILNEIDYQFLTNSTVSLTKIFLCNVNISKFINKTSFANLAKLNLSSNRLTFISRETFINNYMLTHLNLSYNLITVIEKNAFLNQRFLYFLDLSYNRIIDFEDIDDLTIFPMLIELVLASN
jgi:hypothetical protein